MDDSKEFTEPKLEEPYVPDIAADDDVRFAREVVCAVREFTEALEKVRSLRREWDALDLGNTLRDEAIKCISSGTTRSNLGDVFSTFDQIDALLAQGHATNLYRLRGRGL